MSSNLGSKNLNSLQLRALNKMGDILCPANEEFPSFSKLGALEHIDILLDEIPPADLKDLKLLLLLLGLLPSFALRIFLRLVEANQNHNGEVGTILRTIRFGLRGLIFSIYYSGYKGQNSDVTKTPVEIIGYSTQMNV